MFCTGFVWKLYQQFSVGIFGKPMSVCYMEGLPACSTSLNIEVEGFSFKLRFRALALPFPSSLKSVNRTNARNFS